jgi:hypothetical protein
MIVLVKSAGIPCWTAPKRRATRQQVVGRARSDQSSGRHGAWPATSTTAPLASASRNACRSSASSDSSTPVCLLYAARLSATVAMLLLGLLLWLTPARLNGRIGRFGCGTAVVAAGMESSCMRERVRGSRSVCTSLSRSGDIRKLTLEIRN